MLPRATQPSCRTEGSLEVPACHSYKMFDNFLFLLCRMLIKSARDAVALRSWSTRLTQKARGRRGHPFLPVSIRLLCQSSSSLFQSSRALPRRCGVEDGAPEGQGLALFIYSTQLV